MTVGELKQHLYELSEDGEINEDTEIRIAIQPAWAFEHSISHDVTVAGGKFYLAECVQEGYLNDEAREGLGW
tara:strand:- start:32 stop:247 length:216 start_codon:yes stop_codon:yes gene_type:complete